MDKNNDIGKFRRKREAKRFGIRLLVIAAALLVIMVVAANWSSIIAPLKDAALDVGEGGFPVDLPGSTDYVLEELGENFCLLTDTYFYTYNSQGAMIMNEQHGMQNPVISSSSRRALIYDRNGRDFRLYSRTGEVYSSSTDDTIDFAQIGHNERCAVVTKSTKYSNCLYVFSGEGNQIFRWLSPMFLIDRVEFSQDDNSIFVSVCGADNGELEYRILRFDLENAEGSVWQTDVGSDMVFSMECGSGGLFVVNSSGVKLLDTGTGEVAAEAGSVKTVMQIPGGRIRSVLYRDSSGSEVLTVYDDALEAQAAVSLEDVTRVYSSVDGLYVLAGRELTKYDGTLNEVGRTELDDDYSDMIVIGTNAYLLGYNKVQLQALA